MSRVDFDQLKKAYVAEVAPGTITGAINGSNVTFVLSQSPFDSHDAVQVYLDGILRDYTSEWTISGATITFVTAPALGQTLTVNYIMAKGKINMAGKIQNQDIKSVAELVSGGATAASLPNDDKVYVSANSINKTLKQAILDGDIGGGGGGKNYLAGPANGNFENNSTSGWSLFNTTLTGLIPTGGVSSGAASITTFSATATGKLAGNYSLNVAASSAWASGQGFITDARTIDLEDHSTMMSFVAHYKVQSGTFDMSATSANTLAFYIYDVTNAVWIQPSNVYGMDGSGRIIGEFLTSSNGTQYRLAVICVNASGGAVSINFDDFSFGPQLYNQASVVTDPEQYTPVTQGFGVPSGVDVWQMRIGPILKVWGRITTGTVGGSEIQIGLPSGLTVANSVASLRVFGILHREGSVSFSSSPIIANGGLSYVNVGGMISAGSPSTKSTIVAQSGSVVFNNSEITHFEFEVPIEGWAATATSSGITVRARYTTAAGQSVNSQTLINYGDMTYDSHGAVTTGGSWKFTAPISKLYTVAILNAFDPATFTAGLAAYGELFLNGSPYSVIKYERFQATRSDGLAVINGEDDVYMNAGDYIDIRLSQQEGSARNLFANGTYNRITIKSVGN